MSNRRRVVPGVHPYDGPAGGWGALKATAIAVRTQMDALDAPPRCCGPISRMALIVPVAPGPTKNINRRFSSAKTAPKR